MAYNDEVIKLVLETSGEAGVRRLADEAAKLEAELKALNEQWNNGTLATDKFFQQSNALGGQLSRTKEALNSLRGDGQAGGGNSGQGLLGASYAVQDFVSVLSGGQGLTRALGAVTNNVGPVLSSFGAGAGMAGVIQLLFVGVTALIPVVQKLMESFSGTEADNAKETLKELEERTKRIASALEKIRNSQSGSERETEQGFHELFAGQGKQLQGGIAGALQATGKGEHYTPEEAERLAHLERDLPHLTGGLKDDALRAIASTKEAAQQRINAANFERAGQLLGRAPTDAGARATIQALAKASPGNFPKGFAGDMASMEPAAMEAFDREAEAFEEGNEAWRMGKPRRAAATKAATKAARDKAKLDKEVSELEAENAKWAHDMDVKEGKGQAKTDKKNLADVKKAQAARIKQFGEREKRQDALRKKLGPQFLIQAEHAMLAADPHDRKAVMQQITAAAQQRLRAGGASVGEAQLQTMGLNSALQGDMAARMREMGLANNRSGQQQFFQAISQLLGDVAQMSAQQVTAAQQIQMMRQQIRGNLNAVDRTKQNVGTW
jgi:hypothetical protein